MRKEQLNSMILRSTLAVLCVYWCVVVRVSFLVIRNNKMEVNIVEENYSYVGTYYEDATIFITGATGFLGKLILEKLLRAFPNIRRIYLLVRPKRGRSVGERVTLMLGDQVDSNNPKCIYYLQ